MKRPAMRGTQHEAIPRHQSTWNPAKIRASDAVPLVPEASDELSENGPGQRQPSPDVLRRSHHLDLCRSDPQCDLAGRTQSRCNGDG